MPEISLIICTRNRANAIVDTLESIKNQTLDKSKFEVLIVDQSDNDETKTIIENYTDFRHIKLYSIGISVSRQKGLEESKGQILVYVDDDVYFASDYLQEILDFFHNSHLKPDLLGGKVELVFLADKPDWIDGPLLGVLAHSDYGDEPIFYDSHPKHVPYTCNAAIKRECIEKVGGFLGYKTSLNEDVLLANKIRNMGFNVVYNPKMKVFHKISPERLTYDFYKNRYFTQGKSDTYIYFLLGYFKQSDIPAKLFTHIHRIFESIIFKFVKKSSNNWEKYYQKLRLYYNLGCIIELTVLTFNKGKVRENS